MDSQNYTLDVPDLLPSVMIEIDEVGIDHKKQMLTLYGLFPDDPETVTALCEIKLFASLSSKRRGLHLSRMGEILFASTAKPYKSLSEFSIEIAERLKIVQSSDMSHVVVSAFYETKEITPVSKRQTTKMIQLTSDVLIRDRLESAKIGVKVPIITACPCVQMNFQPEVISRMKSIGVSDSVINRLVDNNFIPIISHSQRGHASLIVDDKDDVVSISDLVNVIHKATNQIYDLLKRPDEVRVVEMAHAKPQFVEDVVRQIAVEVYQSLGNKLSPEVVIGIEVESEESIHAFNLRARLETTLGMIANKVNSQV